MLRSIRDLIGYPVYASDGKAGKVVDVLFGDRHWRMRYLDVETRIGFHLNLRYLSSDTYEDKTTRFLLAPEKLEPLRLGLDRRVVMLRIAKDEIRQNPSFAEKQPMEEQYETEFRKFFRHGIYDDRPPVIATATMMSYVPPASAYDHNAEELEAHLKRMKEIGGEHMHSAKAVIGYQVRGENEILGFVGDVLLSVDSWSIPSLVMHTKHGIPAKKYLIGMDKVTGLSWSDSSVDVTLTKTDLENLPLYSPHDPVNEDPDGEHRYDYCGRPCLTELMEEIY